MRRMWQRLTRVWYNGSVDGWPEMPIFQAILKELPMARHA